MVAAIDAYMSESMTAFKFADELDRIVGRTKDDTVHRVRWAFWGHYDDVTDHKIVACKEQWDYFNRLRLLLASNAQLMKNKGAWHWHATQAAAALGLASFIAAWMITGWGVHLYLATLPLGGLAMLIFQAIERRQAARPEVPETLVPFPSMAVLRRVRRSVPSFSRRHYPERLADRRIRSPITHFVMLLPWLLFSPVLLLLQMLPERVSPPDLLVPPL
jgi:hypothetical protein